MTAEEINQKIMQLQQALQMQEVIPAPTTDQPLRIITKSSIIGDDRALLIKQLVAVLTAVPDAV